MPRRALVCLAICVVVSAAGAATVAAHPSTDGAPAASGQAARPVIEGQWNMGFLTTSNRGFTGPAPGSSRNRTWIFERVCGPGGCRLVAERGLAVGSTIVEVVRRGATYVTRYRTQRRCDRGPGSF